MKTLWTIVTIVDLSGDEYYGDVLGAFEDRSDADAMRDKVSKREPVEGFDLDYGLLVEFDAVAVIGIPLNGLIENAQDEIYYQPAKIEDDDNLFSFEVYRNKADAEKDFPGREITEYRNDDIEDHKYVGEDD